MNNSNFSDHILNQVFPCPTRSQRERSISDTCYNHFHESHKINRNPSNILATDGAEKQFDKCARYDVTPSINSQNGVINRLSPDRLSCQDFSKLAQFPSQSGLRGFRGVKHNDTSHVTTTITRKRLAKRVYSIDYLVEQKDLKGVRKNLSLTPKEQTISTATSLSFPLLGSGLGRFTHEQEQQPSFLPLLRHRSSITRRSLSLNRRRSTIDYENLTPSIKSWHHDIRDIVGENALKGIPPVKKSDVLGDRSDPTLRELALASDGYNPKKYRNKIPLPGFFAIGASPRRSLPQLSPLKGINALNSNSLCHQENKQNAEKPASPTKLPTLSPKGEIVISRTKFLSEENYADDEKSNTKICIPTKSVKNKTVETGSQSTLQSNGENISKKRKKRKSKITNQPSDSSVTELNKSFARKKRNRKKETVKEHVMKDVPKFYPSEDGDDEQEID